VDRPVACTSGNPAAAGMLLLARSAVRYRGDFDWPGIAIARRVIERGARPWRLGTPTTATRWTACPPTAGSR
jgi:Protein of unknown function C-terminus (DUF2399)